MQKREQAPLVPQQISHWVSRLLMAVMAHLSNVGEHGCDAQHCKASRPRTISRPVAGTAWGASRLAVIGNRLLALLLKRRCAELICLPANGVLR